MQNVVLASFRLSVALMALLAFSSAAASTVTYWDKPEAETFYGTGGTAITYGPQDLGSPDFVHITFDIRTANMVGSDYAFIMHVDTPTVQTFRLHGTDGASISGRSLGSWQDGPLMHVDIWIDLEARAWTITLGNKDPLRVGFNHTGTINSIRYGVSPWKVGASGGGSVSATVSNMQITNFQHTAVPLPAGVWLLGSALLGLTGWRRLNA